MTPAQRRSWDRFGYAVIPGLLAGERLHRAQAAFGREVQGARRRQRSAPKSADKAPPAKPVDRRVFIPDVLDADPVFLELADHPRLLPLLRHALADDLVLAMAQGFTYEPGDGSFTNWHSDLWHFVGADLTRSCYFARVIVYLSDVAADGGCFAFVPGSHRWPTAEMVKPRGLQRPEDMPHHVAFAAPAGTAIVFNAYGLHTALPNRSERARQAIQLGYVHGWASFLTGLKRPPGRLAEVSDTPMRRQLFGVQPPEYSYETVRKMLRKRARRRG